MLKKALLTMVWMPLCLLFLANNFRILGSKRNITEFQPAIHTKFSSLSSQFPNAKSKNSGKVLGATITSEDARTLLLSKFLGTSVLAPYAQLMVDQADKFGIDYRFVPAIAMCESNLGKRIPSSDSHNEFGIAVYTGQQEGAKFENWESSLLWVFNFIDRKFLRNGVTDLKEIGKIWAPPSVQTNDSWARCVASFMDKIV